MFQWTPEMTVGNTTLDDDHKLFFHLANCLRAAVQSPDDNNTVESILGMLQEYVHGHFMREELAMLAGKYPDLETHMREHSRFTKTIAALIGQYEEAKPDSILRIANDLGEWLTKHIQVSDRGYQDWIKTVEVDTRPLCMLAGTDADDEDELV